MLPFDPADDSAPLRVRDRLDEVLVERALDAPRSVVSSQLGLHWGVLCDSVVGPMLRLARDPQGEELLPTERELRQIEVRARAEATRAREAEAHAREAEARARQAAEQRIQELEAELRRRG